ncbi:MAG: PIG-L deacetylase family protein [Myxococcota bacterium]
MQPLSIPGLSGPAPTVLFLGAHCDDIEIGCGGTVLRLRRERPDVDVRWVVLSSNDARRGEALASARRFLGEGGEERMKVAAFRDGFLPYLGVEVKDFFEELKREIRPDVIFTHTRDDLHQDHRLVCELTWNTWRDHTIFEYEIPKYDGDLGRPNAYVPLPASVVEDKVKALLEVFPSQAQRDWFDEDTFRAILRLRGVESNARERYAEAFTARKCVLEL